MSEQVPEPVQEETQDPDATEGVTGSITAPTVTGNEVMPSGQDS